MPELSTTEGLCAECHQAVPAAVVERDGRVFLRKECARHGQDEILISSDAAWYHRVMGFPPPKVGHLRPATSSRGRCPEDCGFCAEHQQRMLLPVVPITSACDLDCPVCYTINRRRRPYHMSAEEFAAILARIREQDPERQIINLTGGEPLQHPQLLELVRMCGAAGIQRITISTNGLQFLRDETLLAGLAELGARIVFSLNSFREEPYVRMAGRPLLERKLRILELLEKHHPPTTLLTVVAAGINEHEIGAIVRYALEASFIVSSEIHTVAFTGQSAAGFDQATRVTVPDVIAGIAAQNDGIGQEDFVPSPCAHPLCYQTCYLLKLDDGETVPLTRFVAERDLYSLLAGSLYMQPGAAAEETLRRAVDDLWSRAEPGPADGRILSALRALVRRMYPAGGLAQSELQRVAERATKAIYIHSHMDAGTFDRARIVRCCVAVPEAGGRCIPTCAYNLIYRARDPRFCESAGLASREARAPGSPREDAAP